VNLNLALKLVFFDRLDHFPGDSGKMQSAEQSKDGHNATEGESKEQLLDLEDPEVYLEHLLKDGSQEGDSGAELELPSWYDEQLFRR